MLEGADENQDKRTEGEYFIAAEDSGLKDLTGKELPLPNRWQIGYICGHAEFNPSIQEVIALDYDSDTNKALAPVDSEGHI